MIRWRFPPIAKAVLACVLIFYCPLISLGQPDPPKDLPQQKWEDIASYPGMGLTPLYVQSGSECLRILRGQDRWATLPRPIKSIKLSPDQLPCFVMHNGDSYYNGLYGNDKAKRWAAEQNWNGKFKLLLNSGCAAWHKDELVLTDMSFLNGDRWRRYKALGQRFDFGRGIYPKLANASPGSWWWASSSGLFRIENGTLRRIKIKGWKDETFQGIVVDDKGRAVTWSSELVEEQRAPEEESDRGFEPIRYAKVAFFDREQWHTINVPRVKDWRFASIRDDGSFILAGANHQIIVPPLNSQNLKQVESQLRPPKEIQDKTVRAHLALGHFKVNETWCDPQNLCAMAPDGEVLIGVKQVSNDGPEGLVRIVEGVEPTWIDLPDSPIRTSKLRLGKFGAAARPKSDDQPSVRGMQITAQRDGGFVVLEPNRGLYRLDKNSSELVWMTETRSSDQLLGCDSESRVYIGRGDAILVFSPNANDKPAADLREHFELIANERETETPLAAAIDSTGNIVLAVDSGGIASFRDGKHYKYLPMSQHMTGFDQRDFKVARSVWPGRDGWSLVFFQNHRTALIAPDRETVIVDQSLLDLAINSFEEMHAAAPRQSMDHRIKLRTPRNGRQPQEISFAPSPWLAIGNSLWISTPNRTYCLQKPIPDDAKVANENAKDNNKASAINSIAANVRRVGVGGAKMLGPLGSGELILVPNRGKSAFLNADTSESKPESWIVVEKPNNNGDAVLVSSFFEREPPPGNGTFGGSAPQPEPAPTQFTGKWFLDSKSRLWLSQGFDRVYRIESPKKWPLLKEVGIPHFEFPQGTIWGYHSARVFPGYERVDINQTKNSVRPTYLHHLTPIAAVDKHVICLTPTGLAKLEVNSDSPELERIVASTSVQWPGTLKYCIGVKDNRIWFVMQHDGGERTLNVLASVGLQDWTATK